jgi:hypothetical protein
MYCAAVLFRALVGFPAGYPSEFAELCTLMVQPAPDDRPTLEAAASLLLRWKEEAWPPPVRCYFPA